MSYFGKLAALFAVSIFSVSAANAGFQFDPDGGGPKQPVTIQSFDFLVGNSLSKGVLVNGNWNLYYQASLANVVDESGAVIPADGPNGTGLNITHEITIVALISSKTTETGPLLGFGLAPGGQNFIRIYHDNQVNANPLDGTGYNDGELILETHVTDDLQGALMVIPGRQYNLDSFGATNDWGNVKSFNALGGFSASSVVTSFSRNFFLIDANSTINRIFINSSESAPFRQTNPSKKFWDGSNFVVPSIGALNFQSGPDVLLQADANASFLVGPVVAP